MVSDNQNIRLIHCKNKQKISYVHTRAIYSHLVHRKYINRVIKIVKAETLYNSYLEYADFKN